MPPYRMRPLIIVPNLKLAIDQIQMPLVDDHELVVALDLQGLNEPFKVCAQVRRLGRGSSGAASIHLECDKPAPSVVMPGNVAGA